MSGGELEQVLLDEADLAQAQTLVIEAGWNQVEDDWRIFLAQGRVLGLRTQEGGLAASAAILPYRGSGFGWISMVLVAKRWRRQGLASRLLRACIDLLQAEGLVPVLDATPAGRTVYGPLGLQDGWAISRWKRVEKAACPGIAGATGPTASSHQPTLASLDNGAPRGIAAFDSLDGGPWHDIDLLDSLDDDPWQDIAALDLAAFGGQRSALLVALAERSASFACLARSNGAVSGFLLGRNGRTATQVGPIVAENEDTAIRLLDHALERIAGAVQVDALDAHARFSACLAARGFEVERPYTRMMLGRERSYGAVQRMITIAGPELG